MVTIALDAMGSDLGPKATVAGAARASLGTGAPELLLVGDEAILRRLLTVHEHDRARIRIAHAPQVVGQDDKPRAALDAKPECSILRAAELVRDGQADVLVSAGNTGAVTLACARTFSRLPGVARCALGAVYPTERRRGEKDDPFSLILDAGLTLEVDADDLVVFAIMGSAYAARISKNPRPRVALLSNGSEPTKGTRAVVEANRRLADVPGLEFLGNIEGMDIPKGTADVVVTGGFTGNIALKMLEGVAETVMRLGRYAGDESLRYRAGLGLLAPALKKLRRATDWEQYGGAPILGFDHLCIKAHGRSTERAIANALKVATRAARTEMVRSMHDALTALEASPAGEPARG
ncbi:MAG TPA: phosphate acyltransferase PlsX [Sandaracinaceae bacterium LLY-WYZ-13_1]|nr:phosphate acyltransferase PlsX [Sandaracinaceae bacterium LLY-WYZ-13_1]